MPVTGVSGSPALKVSTEFGSTGAPICSLILSITWRAVSGFCAHAGQAQATTTARVIMAALECHPERRGRVLFRPGLCHEGPLPCSHNCYRFREFFHTRMQVLK